MEKRTKRKNFFSSFLAFLVMGIMLIGSLSQIVLAGNYEAGKTGNISLTVQETGDDGTQKPIPNVKLTLYKVGSVSYDGNVHFVADSALQFTGVDFENLKTAEDWYSAAETLSAAVKKIGLTGVEKQSDAQGKIVYSNQPEGMYLIVQDNRDGGKETKIQVTKQLFYIDKNFDVLDMEADDAVYKVGLFLDKDGTIPFRSDYMKDIHLVNAHSGTATWSNVPDGTYYIFELDENGDPMTINDVIEVEDGNTFYYNVTDPDENESNEATVSRSGTAESVSYVNNYYYFIPDGFSLRGYIDITKKVLVDGNEDTVADTFYAGIFREESDGTLTLINNVELEQNGSVRAEVSFEANEEPDSVTYTVMETDEEGNPIDKDTFLFDVSGEGDVVLNKSESYINSIEITNSQETEPDPTATPTPTPGTQPSVTPSQDNNTPGGGTSDNGGTTGRTSVKTGDDTPIGVWVGILAAAVVIGGAAGIAVKRKKKK